MCCGLILGHSLFILGQQRNLEQQQLALLETESMENDERFPIDLARANTEDELKWYQVPEMTKWDGFIVFMALMTEVPIAICDWCSVIFYAEFVEDKLNGTLIDGTCGIAVMAVGVIIANLAVPPWLTFANQIEFWAFKWMADKYLLLIISYSVAIFHCLYLFIYMESLAVYWVLDFTFGLSNGAVLMLSEAIILEVQPTKYSGKVNGLKGLMKNWGAGVGSGVAVLYWEQTRYAVFYVIAVSFGIGLISTVILVCAQKIRYINDHNYRVLTKIKPGV